MNSMKVDMAYSISRRLVARRQRRSRGNDRAAVNWQSYGDWRTRELTKQFHRNFAVETAQGKDVLDFGCGDGSLSMVLAALGAKSVHGIDLSNRSLGLFADRLKSYSGSVPVTFSLNSSTTGIDLPDRSFDAIFCLDVMEHVIAYRETIFEWRRILRPDAHVHIWWQPYWHPFGHHALDWVPIPWAHVFLSDEELNEVCARIVDWPHFKESVWDREIDGTRKNRFRLPGAGGDFLNKLTIREFENVCSDAGFTISRREFHPFSMPQPLRAISAVGTRLAGIRDFFTACAIYDLACPVD